MGIGPRDSAGLWAAVLLCGAWVAIGCAGETGGGGAPAEPDGPRLGDWGVDLSTRQETIRPGDDFYRYANGAWLDTFEIPADLSNYGSFTTLRLEAEADIRAIVEELAEGQAEPGSLEQKVGDFYGSWMDTTALDQRGADPLKPYLAAIAAVGSKDDLQRLFGDKAYTAPFGTGILPDPADTTRYIAFVGQDGLGLPDRNYYLDAGEQFERYRAAYMDYMEKLHALAGIDDPAGRARDIFALETKIAEVHWPVEDTRNVQKIYNPMSLEQLAAQAPQFDWQQIMAGQGLDVVETYVVATPSAIAGAGKIFAETPLDQLKDYVAYHFIRSNGSNLSMEFDALNFEFYGKTLNGTPEQRDRWKRGVSLINGSLGEAVGQIYVERHFPPESKQQMEALVANLTEAFEERLNANEWMDEATKQQALVKLSTFEPRIGYTEKWTDYSDLQVEAGKLLENVMAVNKFQWKEQVDRLSGPVDRQLWPYPPQTVNASYNPLLNQITFPAGILQPPFFDPQADPAVNYGAIGAVIGHEIGHGFDDQGRRFDEVGRIRDWWSEQADQLYSERTDRLGAQYAKYEPLPDLFVNPELTMGENIGDLGGLEMAYAAYRRYLDANAGGEAEVIDGLSGDQRFFLGWAQVWRSLYRDDALRQRTLTDPHSPPEFRVNGVVRNHDAWYTAFGVQEGDALYLPPDERVRIW